MKLLYVWIKKHGNIVEQGFNFSGEYTFTCSKRENNESLSVLVEQNTEYVDLFNSLGDQLLISITGVIGKNGAGKSTLLQYLIRTLVEGHNHYLPEGIYIFKDKNNNLVGCSGQLVDFKDIEGKNYKIKAVKDLKSYHREHSIIYFTNNFYDKIDSTNWLGMCNISLRGLLEEGDPRYYNKETLELKGNQNLLVHKQQEINRIVQFYSEYKDSIPEINFPKFLRIKTNNVAFDILQRKDMKKHLIDAKLTKLISNIHGYFGVPYPREDATFRDLFLKQLLGAIIFHTVIDQNTHAVEDVWIPIFDKSNKEAKLSSSFEELPPIREQIEIIIEAFQYLANHYSKSFYYKSIVELIETFDKWLSKEKRGPKDIFGPSKHDLFVPLDDAEFIDEILSKYIQTTVLKSGYLDFDFSTDDTQAVSLSAGEHAYLSMFSRIFYTRNSNLINNSLRNNLLLLIDEGDLYLHPVWQKEFVFKLYKILPQIFGGIDVQIVLTSHSPFIASDMPHQNIIFLDQADNGSCKVIKAEEFRFRTFAANIHNLYGESFFIEDGLIGKFAEHKIKQVIEWLNKQEKGEKNLTKLYAERQNREIERIINLIDESIISSKLREMYAKKMGDDETKDKMYDAELKRLNQKYGKQ